MRAPRLEAIAFQVADVLEAVQSETPTPLSALRVDGGAAVNDLLMQFQADILGVPVVRPQVTETTALGAAYLAGLATGFWASPGDLRAKPQNPKTPKPQNPSMLNINQTCISYLILINMVNLSLLFSLLLLTSLVNCTTQCSSF